MNFLDAFGAHNFLIRDAIITLLVGFSVFAVLNAGMFAMPQIGFMALGAYTAAILNTDHGMPLTVTLGAAALAGGMSGLLLGGLLRRLDGIYLAIGTIGFAEIVRLVARNLDITGGPSGVLGVDRSLNDLQLCVLAATALAALARISRTHIGRAIATMREDPLMAMHQGINLQRYRIALFTLSGTLSGLAGGVYVHIAGYAHPNDYTFGKLVTVVAAVILGGATSVIGPIVGTVITVGVPEMLRSLNEYRSLLNGSLIVLIIAFAPSGIAPVVGTAWRRAIVGVRRSSRGHRSPTPDQLDQHPAPVTMSQPRAPAADVVLSVQGISKSFGGVRALADVSLVVESHDVLGVIGPNGSGKTTLLNVLSGIYSPETGDLRLDGKSVAPMLGHPELLARAGIARTFQTIRIVGAASVYDNVAIGAHLLHTASVASAIISSPSSRRDRAAVHCAVESALERVGLTSLATTPAGSLAYGLQRKVEIARAMVRQPKVLLLDEPTAGMAPNERDEVFALVSELSRNDIAVIVVEHDVESISANCNRIMVLNFGRIIASGAADDVLREEGVIDAYLGRSTRG
ncbi:MAG: hypothetical protein JWM12_963 [Ilumatobacteraceae bacterium]|nr:hypothetical protein [Ilumatobacteraceae bacterium]